MSFNSQLYLGIRIIIPLVITLRLFQIHFLLGLNAVLIFILVASLGNDYANWKNKKLLDSDKSDHDDFTAA